VGFVKLLNSFLGVVTGSLSGLTGDLVDAMAMCACREISARSVGVTVETEDGPNLSKSVT
jgi:hypothetical protein